MRKFFMVLVILIIAGILSLVIPNIITENFSKNRLYKEVNTIPANKVGLLLGTSKYLASGHVNLYYQNRLEAALELFNNNKIEYLLISGDNSRKDYNEPEMFKQDLMKKGIPEDKIYLDYAGFRTLDSVVRAKKIFGQHKITLISQQFHNERAIYICKNKGIDAIGFNAKDVSLRYGFKIKVREKFARLKMMIDLYITRKGPKYLGEEIKIS